MKSEAGKLRAPKGVILGLGDGCDSVAMIVLDVSKIRSASIFRVKYSENTGQAGKQGVS
jgi:hypothetical protein